MQAAVLLGCPSLPTGYSCGGPKASRLPRLKQSMSTDGMCDATTKKNIETKHLVINEPAMYCDCRQLVFVFCIHKTWSSMRLQCIVTVGSCSLFFSSTKPESSTERKQTATHCAASGLEADARPHALACPRFGGRAGSSPVCYLHRGRRRPRWCPPPEADRAGVLRPQGSGRCDATWGEGEGGCAAGARSGFVPEGEGERGRDEDWYLGFPRSRRSRRRREREREST